MKCKIKFSLVIVLSLLFVNNAFMQNISQVKFEGKNYYVDIRTSVDSKTKDKKAEVWLTEKNNSSSLGDKLILKLSVKNLSIESAKKFLCDAKDTYDGGKAVIGCMATAASTGCLMAMALTGPTPVILEISDNVTPSLRYKLTPFLRSKLTPVFDVCFLC